MENGRTALSRIAEHAALLEALPCPMYIVGPDGEIAAANRAFHALARIDAAEAPLSRGMFADLDFYDAEGTHVPRDQWPSLRVLRTGEQISQQYELRVGGAFDSWIVVTGGPLRDNAGQLVAAVMSITNITDQKLIEQELRERNDELTLAQKIAGCGMFVVNPKTGTISVSEAFATLCGRPDKALSGTYEDWLECIEPELREGFSQRLIQAWEGGADLEFSLRRADTGERRWMIARGQVFRDPDGRARRMLGFLIDATELRAAEERYRHLMETVPVGIAVGHVSGPDFGLITLANQTYLDLLGYTREDIDAGRIRWTDFTPQRWWPTDVKALRQLRATGCSKIYEKEVRRKDGRILEVECAMAKLAGDGEVVAYIRDISDRKGLEEELRRRDAEKTAIFNAVPAGVSVVTNTADRWREANPAWLQIQGFSSIEEMRRSVAQGEHRLYYPMGEPIPLAEWPSSVTLRTGQPVPPYEILIRRHDDLWIPAIVSSAPAFGADGNVIAAVVSIVEISAQKRVEDSLRRRESERDAMLRALPTGMCVLDASQQVVEANRIWAEMFGFSSVDEMKSKRVFAADLIRRYAPDGSPVTHDMWVSSIVLRTGRAVRDVEMLCERQDTGHRCVALFSAAPVIDAAGRLERVVVTAQDITQLKGAQETARVRTEQLASSNEELQAFAYTASHDLQEPLRTIALYTELLDRRCPSPESVCVQYRQTIRSNALRMQDMLQSLLAYSQLGQLDRPKAAVDVNRVIEHALRSLESSKQPDDDIVIEVMPVVQAWEGRLEQVFQNLIGNALKYRKPGNPVHIHVGCRSEGREWLFRVSDDGIGFHPDYAERIFGIFRRLHGRTEYGGTGIGLTIVRRIVERHAGRIWAEGREGEGSTFYFTLPKWG